MALYLVTGGAGFIGSNLVEALLKRGEQVRVLDNFSTGRRENLNPFRGQFELLEGDICDYQTVQQAVAGVEYVLHQAALPSVPRSIKDPLASNAVIVGGTLNILQAAREAGVKRLVYASSSSVYGDNPALPKQESMTPNPLSPYAVAKLAAEQYCRLFYPLYGFETVALRYFNVFGPRQDPTSQYSAVIPKFITALLHDQPITIHGDGTQSRDFTYIANVVQANLRACTAPAAPGQAFNIACGERYSLLQLVDTLAGLTGKSPQIQHVERRAGDVPHSLADISRAKECLGYNPLVTLSIGLQMTIDSYL